MCLHLPSTLSPFLEAIKNKPKLPFAWRTHCLKRANVSHPNYISFRILNCILFLYLASSYWPQLDVLKLIVVPLKTQFPEMNIIFRIEMQCKLGELIIFTSIIRKEYTMRKKMSLQETEERIKLWLYHLLIRLWN